jgi:translation initiation factor 1
MNDHNSKLVYSTDRDVPRKEKGKVNSPLNNSTSASQEIIVRLERKGRGGKSVTVVECLLMNQNSKLIFLKQLKAKLGTGGTIKDDCFEFQGDHCSRLMAELKKMGYKPKRSGG